MSEDLPAIELNGVGVQRDGRWILRGVDWRVPAGACAAILGPNGSGKSTLARIVGCHIWPSEGHCRVLGNLFGETDLMELRRAIRLVQPAGPYDMDPELTTRQVVLTGLFGSLGLYDAVTPPMREKADRVLEQIGLTAVADHPYRTLSNGERVRSLIGRALVRKPRLLLLDEPTTGLDLLGREQVLATVQALFEAPGDHPTVVLITHHVEELPPATSTLLLLQDGQVLAGGPPAQVMREDVLSRVYRCPVQLRRSNGRYYAEVHPQAWNTLLKRRG
jgi:iron complex transport system ATP-binding protein